MMAGKFQESCAYPPRLMNADRADLARGFPTIGRCGNLPVLKIQAGCRNSLAGRGSHQGRR
jgi:hypothetical protein